ncbi:MAG: ATP synthase F1 subunit delta [Bacteroidota bacterium]
MLETKVAKRYAKSLIDLSREKGVLDAVNDDMTLLVSVCEANRDLALLLGNPIISADKKLSVLKAVFGNGRVSELSLAFFDIITRKGRESHLVGIAKEFVSQYKKSKGIETAVVTTAAGLDDNLRKEVYRTVRESMKSEVELVEKVDKDLIGGFVLRVGDKLYDASVASELRKLAREFSSNPFIRKN